MTSTILLTFFMITTLFLTKFFHQKLLKSIDKKKNDDETDKTVTETLMHLMDESFSFVRIIDSKFIGLQVFLVSNVLTGLVNLIINTLTTPVYLSFLIICLYSLFSFGLPYIYFYIFVSKKPKA